MNNTLQTADSFNLQYRQNIISQNMLPKIFLIIKIYKEIRNNLGTEQRPGERKWNEVIIIIITPDFRRYQSVLNMVFERFNRCR